MIARGLHTVFATRRLDSRTFYRIPLSGLLMAALIGLIAIPPTGLAQSAFRRGDVDGDGEVGARDFALFQRYFGQDLTALDIPCQDAYDINDDGFPFTNLFDFVTLVAAMGQPETLPAPGGIDVAWTRPVTL